MSWRPYPTNSDEWGELLAHVSTVYHFAWSGLPQSSNQDPEQDAQNIISTLQLLEAAKKKAQLRLVFASSGGTVYGILNSPAASEQHRTRPRCAYGVSKLAVENYLTMYRDLWGLDCVSLRISNAYGPGQKVGRNFGAVSTFVTRVAQREPITIFGDGSVVRDYIYVDDLVEAVIATGEYREGPTVMNVGSGVGASLNDIVEAIRILCPNEVDVSYGTGRALDVPVSVLDISLASSTLGWKPRTSLRAGIEATYRALQVPELAVAGVAAPTKL